MKTALRWKVQDEYQRPKLMNKYYIATQIGNSTVYRTPEGTWGIKEEAYVFDSFDIAFQTMEFMIEDEKLDKDNTVIRLAD